MTSRKIQQPVEVTSYQIEMNGEHVSLLMDNEKHRSLAKKLLRIALTQEAELARAANEDGYRDGWEIHMEHVVQLAGQIADLS